jgi:hypothetical protein
VVDRSRVQSGKLFVLVRAESSNVVCRGGRDEVHLKQRKRGGSRAVDGDLGVEERVGELSEEAIDALEGDGVPRLREEGRVRVSEASEGVETVVIMEVEMEVAQDVFDELDGEDGERGPVEVARRGWRWWLSLGRALEHRDTVRVSQQCKLDPRDSWTHAAEGVSEIAIALSKEI